MTEDDKTLVERLRGDLPDKKVESHWITDYTAVEMQNREAADRIEALSAENERLREVLGDLIEAVQRRTADLGGYDGRFGLNKSIVKARAALGETK